MLDELMGNSHQRVARIKRDNFVKEVYASAGLRFKIVKAGRNFSKVAREIIFDIQQIGV